MPLLKCPHLAHLGDKIPLKSNNEKVFECEMSHRYYRRLEGEEDLLVDLISGKEFPPEPYEETPEVDATGALRRRLNFMVDVPRVATNLDFNALSLTPSEWKVISRVDGRSTLEEVRLLAGMKVEEAQAVIFRLMDAGLVELRRRGR